MPIELLYTDSDLLKIRTRLLKKAVITSEDLATIKEINDYCNRPA